MKPVLFFIAAQIALLGFMFLGAIATISFLSDGDDLEKAMGFIRTDCWRIAWKCVGVHVTVAAVYYVLEYAFLY